MGLRYVKRPRMESLPNVPDEVLVGIGSSNIQFSHFEEDLIYWKVNRRLDVVQERINNS